ncbi:protein ENDOSPERM DEFECTIVE 1-like isoform X2 [Argentina anserina]|uniref:protein ENDOSPERM DEFECTIVE 1-like isoform X2 n=1 Tax=Argentina anserina TaxID=57926 RepID=UPI002176419D|nr:protein ENDOSPERM DEFECTIVE 1-like isoform X2 [Potentilla anserina]
MDQSMVESGAAAPHPPQRRPRVREVSSRFMSPVDSTDPHPTRSPLPRHNVPTPSPHQRSRRHLDMEPFRCSDENRPTPRPESPLPPSDQQQPRKQRPVKPPLKEKENGGLAKTPRPDTPMVTATPRIRLISHQRVGATVTAASKLLKSTTTEVNIQEHPSDTRRCLSDLRSSMPEADMLPTVSSTVDGSHVSKYSASPCSRSLNLPLSSSDHLHFQSARDSKPPVPPCYTAKPGSELRKGKKEEAHSLRLLQNRYLQWRYANATAEASMLAQQRQTERSLYSLALQLTELYDSVKRKRIELGILQRTKTLSTILEAQIPYMDQWVSLQEDYSISLEEATKALLNISLRLPISANVKANKKEVEEALNSAKEVMEKIIFHVQQSIPKAEETDHLISELARVIGGERTLVEECGNLLSKTYTTQVEECSLRGHIIQLKLHC